MGISEGKKEATLSENLDEVHLFHYLPLSEDEKKRIDYSASGTPCLLRSSSSLQYLDVVATPNSEEGVTDLLLSFSTSPTMTSVFLRGPVGAKPNQLMSLLGPHVYASGSASVGVASKVRVV